MHQKWCGRLKLRGDFRQDFEAAHACCKPDLAPISLLFHAANRGVTARPPLLAASKFGGQNEHDLEIASGCDVLLGVEEYPIAAKVARVPCGLKPSVVRLQGHWDLRNNSLLGTPFGWFVAHAVGRRVPQCLGKTLPGLSCRSGQAFLEWHADAVVRRYSSWRPGSCDEYHQCLLHGRQVHRTNLNFDLVRFFQRACLSVGLRQQF